MPIVPIYSTPSETFGFNLDGRAPMYPAQAGVADEDLEVYELIARYVRDMERCFSRDPYHWIYWDNLMQRSTAFVDPVRSLDASALQQELARLFATAVPLVRRQPELHACFERFQSVISQEQAA